MGKQVHIRKADGQFLPFDEDKFLQALQRSGASEQEAKEVLHRLKPSLVEGISTAKIYRLAKQQLRQVSSRVAGRYALKKAVFDLGPGGYPFEKFVGRLLAHQGYEVQLNVIAQGKCVRHELDVVAANAEEKIMVECKFHRAKGHKNDVKIPLYIHSRFLDMKAQWQAEGDQRKLSGMIVTNTRFSLDAMDYGRCVGLQLISWDYPSGQCLRDWVDASGYHPVTSLQSLSSAQYTQLLERDIVLCRDILEQPEVLQGLGLGLGKQRKVMEEAKAIVNR